MPIFRIIRAKHRQDDNNMLTSAIFTRTLMLEQKVISPAAFHAVADSEVVTTGASCLHASLVAKMILRRYKRPGGMYCVL